MGAYDGGARLQRGGDALWGSKCRGLHDPFNKSGAHGYICKEGWCKDIHFFFWKYLSEEGNRSVIKGWKYWRKSMVIKWVLCNAGKGGTLSIHGASICYKMAQGRSAEVRKMGADRGRFASLEEENWVCSYLLACLHWKGGNKSIKGSPKAMGWAFSLQVRGQTFSITLNKSPQC